MTRRPFAEDQLRKLFDLGYGEDQLHEEEQACHEARGDVSAWVAHLVREAPRLARHYHPPDAQ